MKSNVLVSVVIPTYKRPSELRRALRSVVYQSFSSYEIIVIDDNEDPLIESKVKEICFDFNAFYFKNSRKKGGCGARNTGILESKGKYIAFLDDDDYWLNEKLLKQVSFMESNSIGASYSGFYILHEEKKIIREVNKNKTLCFKDFMKRCCPASSSLVIARKDLIKEAGMFDEDLPSFQDFDLWARVSKIENFYFLNHALSVFTFHQGDRTSVNVEKRFKGLEIIVEKWGGDIDKISNRNAFVKRFRSSAYSSNALANEGLNYRKTLAFRVLAIKEDALNLRLYRNFFISILGGRFFWSLMKMKGHSDNKIARLINYEYYGVKS